jgi:cyclopropane fatty-acyl-phospholipid synthase-like methyltransferase
MHLIEGMDWSQAWIDREGERQEPEDCSYWDGRAEGFASKAGSSSYAATFIQFLGEPKGKNIMDMGGGSGTLAIPLALAGNKVLLCDFSPKMLECGLELAAQKQVPAGFIETKLLSWADDWRAAGIAEKSVDYVLASRSIMVADLAEALEKMDRTATQRAVLTLSTEYTPRGKYELGKPHMGQSSYVPDHIYAINILFEKGAYPELRYVDSYKTGRDGERQLIRWAYIAWEPV